MGNTSGKNNNAEGSYNAALRWMDAAGAPSAMAHTPGPWMYEPSTQARYSWLVLTADFDENRNVGLVICRTSDGISEADARLIAAAPDLYAACKAALADRFGGDDPCCDNDPITNRLRAALRKAEGGAA